VINRRTHYFPSNDCTAVTGLLPTGEFCAFLMERDVGRVRGFGHTRLAAITDMVEAIGRADESEEDLDRRANRRAAQFDRAQDHRKNWIA
jgi:hypothetical protein